LTPHRQKQKARQAFEQNIPPKNTSKSSTHFLAVRVCSAWQYELIHSMIPTVEGVVA
jgi:hypothetical protein